MTFAPHPSLRTSVVAIDVVENARGENSVLPSIFSGRPLTRSDQSKKLQIVNGVKTAMDVSGLGNSCAWEL
jgi:hypothetical protein